MSPPNRSTQTRVTERLRRLRERFATGVRNHQVDHDHDHLTSTRREHVPERTFFLGEIWWAERWALGDHRPHREGSGHLTALVTRRQHLPGEPVEVAPPCPRSMSAQEAERLGCFGVSGRDGLREGANFALTLRRPLARAAFGSHPATLDGMEKQSLVAALNGGRSHA